MGDGKASWERTLESLPYLEPYGHERLLLVAQEGSDLDAIAGLARELGAGAFVGGRTDAFKVRAARALKTHRVRRVHVGRVSRAGLFEALAGVADSVDSTSFVQTRDFNRSMEVTYRHLLVEYALPRSTPWRDPK